MSKAPQETLETLHSQVATELLGRIKTPTLIVVGDEDVATTPAKSEKLHAAIKGSRLEIVKQAGHTSSIEQPEAINKLISKFLDEA